MKQTQFVKSVESGWPVSKWRDFTVLVAVSGGSDSVGMLHAVHRLYRQSAGAGQLAVVHVNHGLRGEKSLGDERFVQEVSDSLGLPSTVLRLQPNLTSSYSGQSVEGFLRRQRYEAFEQAAARAGARYLLTGHTRDDQVETVLFRIMRGTGIDGLAGIPRQRPLNSSLTVVRPMLSLARREIVQFLKSIGQSWRDDETNASDEFSRNRIRMELLPLMRDVMGDHVDQSLISLADRAAKQTDLIKSLAKPILDSSFRVKAGLIVVDTSLGKGVPSEIRKAALRMAWSQAGFPTADMSTRKWDLLRQHVYSDELSGEPPMFPGGVRLTVRQDQVILATADGQP